MERAGGNFLFYFFNEKKKLFVEKRNRLRENYSVNELTNLKLLLFLLLLLKNGFGDRWASEEATNRWSDS